MTRRTQARIGTMVGALLAILALAALGAAAASATPEVVYDNLESPKPANVQSVSFEATQGYQLGGLVQLAGANRKAGTLFVGLSVWACQHGVWGGTPECQTTAGAKFEIPLTLHVNAVGPFGEVGAMLLEQTKIVKLPYRPSESRLKCVNPSTNEPTGAYYYKGQCYHGKYVVSMFAIRTHFVWPSEAIISVSYNTSDYGTTPQRPQPCNSEPQGCPYDSLNVALTEGANVTPSVGTDPRPNGAYWDTTYAPYYCDGGLGGVGVFRLDEGCWTGSQPTFELKASP